MKILAVDTSTNVAAAAVLEKDTIIGEYICNRGKTHSQRLMPMIAHMLEVAGLTVKDIDLFAASVGPGSFTGLRIGVTTMKAMAFAAGKPVISVHTLDALAYNLPMSKALICPMIDARNSQVFTAVYRLANGKPQRLTDYMGIHVGELSAKLSAMEGEVVFLGDACGLHRDYFAGELGARAVFAPSNVASARASSVAAIAMDLYLENKTETCYEMVPYYLRKSQAEREKEKIPGDSE